MTRFRARPVEVDAIQFDGENVADLREFAPYRIIAHPVFAGGGVFVRGPAHCNTRIYPGEWLVRKGPNSYEVLAEDVFDAEYEPADEA